MAVKLRKDMLTRSLMLKHKLAHHIDKAIAQGEFEWSPSFIPKEGDLAWHPSGDCVPSPYVLYHHAVKPELSTLTASTYKTFALGQFFHAYLQYIVVEKLGFATWDDVERKGKRGWGDKDGDGRWKPFHWVAGSGDIAPCHVPSYGDWVVDFKTMNSFDYRLNGLPNWCAAKYECQINIYMDLFDLDQGMLVCVQKDSPHDLKEICYRRNQPLIDAIYAKWLYVSHCLETNEPPSADLDIPLPLEGPIT